MKEWLQNGQTKRPKSLNFRSEAIGDDRNRVVSQTVEFGTRKREVPHISSKVPFPCKVTFVIESCFQRPVRTLRKKIPRDELKYGLACGSQFARAMSEDIHFSRQNVSVTTKDTVHQSLRFITFA